MRIRHYAVNAYCAEAPVSARTVTVAASFGGRLFVRKEDVPVFAGIRQSVGAAGPLVPRF